MQRRLGLRSDDGRPRWGEIALHVVAWSIAAEIVMPHLVARATADWRDVIAYSAGALGAGAWWHLGGAT